MDFPKWKEYLEGYGGMDQLEEMQDEEELRFFCRSIVRSIAPNAKDIEEARGCKRIIRDETQIIRFYVTAQDAILRESLLSELREWFAVDCSTQGASLIESCTLSDGRTLRHVNFYLPNLTPCSPEAVVAQTSPGLLWVTGAEKIDGPRPDVSLDIWHDRSRIIYKSRPYFCHLCLHSYTRAPGEIGFSFPRLGARWRRVLNPEEYAEMLQARKLRKSKQRTI